MAGEKIILPRTLVLFSKLVLVMVPLFCLLAASGLYFVYNERFVTERDALATRIGNSVGRSAGTLEQILSINQTDDALKLVAAQQILLLLLGDQSIKCATLSRSTETAEQLAAPIGLGCSLSEVDDWLTIDLSTPGWASLRVGFSNEELEVVKKSQLRDSLIVLLGSLAASLMSSWLAFRWIVGKPLNNLIKDLVEARDAAEHANETKVRFLANMSHEIRTPMNGIIGTTEILSESDLDNSQRRSVQTISSSANALMTIIEDILDFAKIEAAHLELNEQEFSLENLVTDVFDLIEPATRSKGLHLSLNSIEEHPHTFIGDQGRLRQVLLNLLANAVKFTPKGNISLTIQLNSYENYSDVKFRVADMGIGIPADKLETIFQPFSQVSDETTRQFEGTGLGLSISSELVTLMNGKLSVTSTLGEGSEFEFTIPLHHGNFKETPNEITELLQLTRSRPFNVLIASPLNSNQEIISKWLSKWSITFETICDTAEIINKMIQLVDHGTAFDAVIIGLSSPTGENNHLTSLIRDNPKISKTPLIILSQSTDIQTPSVKTSHHFNEILTKPITSKELARKLNTALKDNNSKTHQIVIDSTVYMDELFKGVDFLLVDDNEINRRILTLQLAPTGASIRTACDGSEAVEIQSKNPADIVLMDISMPIMNGFDAAKAIREIELNQLNQPSLIFAVSGNVLKEHKEAAEEAGMDGFIGKPTRRENLIETIAPRWINSGRQRSKTMLQDPTDLSRQSDARNESQLPPLINETAISDLHEMLGDIEYDNFVALLVKNGDQTLTDIYNHLDHSDTKAAADAAHKFSGGAGSFGCLSIAEAMSALAHDLYTNKQISENRLPNIKSTWTITKDQLSNLSNKPKYKMV